MPERVLDWADAWVEFRSRHQAGIKAANEIQDRITVSGDDESDYLDEIRDQLDEFNSDDGAYQFVMDGALLRFAEVRALNDRIVAWVESVIRQNTLYIKHLESPPKEEKHALWEQSNELWIARNAEWLAMVDAVTDFLRARTA